MADIVITIDEDLPGSRSERPVCIDDDDIGNDFQARHISARASVVPPKFPARREDDIINLEEHNYEEEIRLLESPWEFVDLTEDTSEQKSAARPKAEVFSPSPASPEQETRTFNQDGITFKKGMVVELQKPIGRWKIEFLRIERILPTPTGPPVLRGVPYTRARNLHGMLPQKLNEVCAVIQVNDADGRLWSQQALVDVPAHPGLAVRQELRTTNAPYPEHRFTAKEYLTHGKQWVEKNAPLVCRYRIFWHYADSEKKKQDKAHEWALMRITADEADGAYRLRDEAVLNNWRGGKIPGGSHRPNRPAIPTVDLDRAGDAACSLLPGQRYLAGDTFSGCGGASRGMERAGLQVAFGVDHWEPASESYKANFPSADFYYQEMDQFIVSSPLAAYVDFLHLSPPCQVWSPAHTIVGKNDEANTAALFACTHLVKKCKPRLFTLEQTFGMLHPAFEDFFNLLVHGFAEYGYSVRWKIINFSLYGLPQPRRRLIMFGAGPGEKLPPFPEPTHGNGAGLRPLVTAHAALARLAGLAGIHPLHDPRAQRPLAKKPWSPHAALPRTITCGGGQNYHWSGTRNFTLLEYAVLQGFPPWHRFCKSHVRKQIGNAFPPCIVRLLYAHLTGWLDTQDGITRAARRPFDLAQRQEVVELDVGSELDGRIEYLISRRHLAAEIGFKGERGEDRKALDRIAKHIKCIDLDGDDDPGLASDTSEGTLCGETSPPLRTPSPELVFVGARSAKRRRAATPLWPNKRLATIVPADMPEVLITAERLKSRAGTSSSSSSSSWRSFHTGTQG